MIVAIFIGSINSAYFIMCVVVSTKAISKRGGTISLMQCIVIITVIVISIGRRKDDFVSIESSSPEEQTTESAENNVEEESEDNLNGESTTVIAPGEDIKKLKKKTSKVKSLDVFC